MSPGVGRRRLSDTPTPGSEKGSCRCGTTFTLRRLLRLIHFNPSNPRILVPPPRLSSSLELPSTGSLPRPFLVRRRCGGPIRSQWVRPIISTQDYYSRGVLVYLFGSGCRTPTLNVPMFPFSKGTSKRESGMSRPRPKSQLPFLTPQRLSPQDSRGQRHPFCTS